MKKFPIVECARIAYGGEISDNVEVMHTEELSACQFMTARGDVWQFIYSHTLEAFALICGKRMVVPRRQRQMFDYLNRFFYDKSKH